MVPLSKKSQNARRADPNRHVFPEDPILLYPVYHINAEEDSATGGSNTLTFGGKRSDSLWSTRAVARALSTISASRLLATFAYSFAAVTESA